MPIWGGVAVETCRSIIHRRCAPARVGEAHLRVLCDDAPLAHATLTRMRYACSQGRSAAVKNANAGRRSLQNRMSRASTTTPNCIGAGHACLILMRVVLEQALQGLRAVAHRRDSSLPLRAQVRTVLFRGRRVSSAGRPRDVPRLQERRSRTGTIWRRRVRQVGEAKAV